MIIMDTTSIINRLNKRCAGGLDGGHVGRLILRLSEEEQRQRKVEAPEGLFQMARYVLKKKEAWKSHTVTSMERESHSVSLSCNFKLSSNSTFPILYSFQAAPVQLKQYQIFHVSSGPMKTPFQPWCRSDGHQFYWGGSGRGVTGRCKWKGVATGMGLDRREMLNVSKVTQEESWKECGLFNFMQYFSLAQWEVSLWIWCWILTSWVWKS